MKQPIQKLRHFIQSEEGLSAGEYAILIAGIVFLWYIFDRLFL